MGTAVLRALMYSVFELDPAEEGDGNDEVKESFVGDCENDEGWPECEENDHMAVEVILSWTQDMGKGQDEGCNCSHGC